MCDLCNDPAAETAELVRSALLSTMQGLWLYELGRTDPEKIEPSSQLMLMLGIIPPPPSDRHEWLTGLVKRLATVLLSGPEGLAAARDLADLVAMQNGHAPADRMTTEELVDTVLTGRTGGAL